MKNKKQTNNLKAFNNIIFIGYIMIFYNMFSSMQRNDFGNYHLINVSISLILALIASGSNIYFIKGRSFNVLSVLVFFLGIVSLFIF